MTNAEKIMRNAEEYCEREGARLTDPRRYVLEILINANKAMTAYEVLDALGNYLDKPKPPTAYRAIDFWVETGFVHRIESLNAYMVCSEGHSHKGSQFMICDDCGDVSEAHITLPENDNGFSVSRWSVELHGQCGRCNDND